MEDYRAEYVIACKEVIFETIKPSGMLCYLDATYIQRKLHIIH